VTSQKNIIKLLFSKGSFVFILITMSFCLVGQNAMLFDTPTKSYVYGSENGFDGKFIKKILKDREGFLWIACSDGIYRFDGKRFKSFYYDPESNLSFKQGEYLNIFEDSKGRIWMTGFDGGVCYIDKKENRTHQFSHSSTDSTSIASLHTGSVYEDSKGVIWVCSSNYVLHKFDEESKRFTRYKVDIPSHYLNYENEFSYFGDIVEDTEDDNILWVGSRFGLVRFDKSKEESTLFPLKKANISWFRYGYTPIPLIQVDEQVWLGSAGDQGLFIFDKKTATYREPIILDQKGLIRGGNKVVKFLSSGDSTIQALTLSGLWEVDKTKLEPKGHKITMEEGFKYISDLLLDNGDAWIVADNKLRYITKQQLPISNNYLRSYYPGLNKGNAIISILQSKDEAITYFSTLGGDGIWRYDRHRKEMTVSRLRSSDSPSDFDFDFNDMTYDPYGKLWIAASYQLGSLDEGERKIIVEPTYPKLGDLIKDPITYRIAADSQYIWLALFENGIVRMDINTHNLIPFENEKDYILLDGQRISALELDDNGKVWIGTDEGLKYFDVQTNKLLSPTLETESVDLSQIKINDIDFHEGKLYLGTFGHGLIIVDVETLKAEIQKNPNPRANLIFKVDVGEESVWSSSQFGLSSHDLKDMNVVNFSNDDIAANPWIEFELKSIKDGTIYFGNEWQFLSFNPKAMRAFGEKPIAYIDELASQNSTQKSWVNTQGKTEIDFEANDRDFALTLGAINYNPISNNIFTYRLRGYDDQWHTALDDQKISYTNLKPGDYLFEYNAQDQYSDKELDYNHLNITIKAKYYETLWFKVLMFLIIAGGFWIIANLKERRRRKRNQSKLVLDYITSASFSSQRSEKIAQEIIQYISTTFDFKSCSIYLRDEDSNLLELKAYSKVTDNDGDVTTSFNLEDLPSKKGLSRLRKLANMTWEYRAPLEYKNNTSGALSLIHSKKNYFKDGVAEYFDEVANIIAFKLNEASTQRKIELKDQELLELQQMRIKAELSALRAQMNPHFLFNTLNSINWFIIKNKPVEASRYLTKFSKLVRTILDNSKQPLITLERELESLELYIDLESIRFTKKFESKIELGEGIDLKTLLIPPLIFQPFVENAIWHGLMHKKDPGKLLISIRKANHVLECSVIDNGVGRDFISTIKQAKKTTHKSEGIKITRERILILDPTLKNPLLIHDLKNEKGEGIGTNVVLNLPILFVSDDNQVFT